MTVTELRQRAQQAALARLEARTLAPVGRSYEVVAANEERAVALVRCDPTAQADAMFAPLLHVERLGVNSCEVVLQDGWIEDDDR